LTVIDQNATFQVPRLLRWRRGERGLTEIAHDTGPGGSIDPAGRTYYYAWVDGDRWSLAAYDTASGAHRMVHEVAPGTYVLTAQVSPDGARVAASVWDGHAFVVWIVDAASGAIERRIGGDPAQPVYDPSFTSDGRVLWLDKRAAIAREARKARGPVPGGRRGYRGDRRAVRGARRARGGWRDPVHGSRGLAVGARRGRDPGGHR
jgi:hypothetical protein